MPKKHYRNNFAKPVSTPHHSLTSSPHSSQNDRSSTASSSGEQPSVNDLIHHLRRTQLPSDNNRGSPHIAPRSVHPSLRNVLDLPETPPPRPRPDAPRTIIGARRLRRTPGPAPPESWLSGDTSAGEEKDDYPKSETTKVIYRLERLPGREFPSNSSLLHALLKSMAMHWNWHVAYDGPFLGVLPTHIKLHLLSYIGYYARDQSLVPMRGLRPLFGNPEDSDDEADSPGDDELRVKHLDFSSALGRWTSLKQLSKALFVSKRAGPTQPDTTDTIPTSWDEDEGSGPVPNSTIPKSLQHLRFANLQFLSLAHPHPSSVNWNSLINFLSRLSTITHLSLAHWPVPTVTPNSLNASIRHPNHRSLVFSYSGIDPYSSMENNWAESAGILRRLSRVTYCLKWLDLEGCSDWIPALNWQGAGPNGESYSTGSGPEWNGSWRDIEYIRLGPGWLPRTEIADGDILSMPTPDVAPPAMNPQSLGFSAHAPASPAVGTETWDVEVERQKYRAAKELERFRESILAAKGVQQRILAARKEGKGKWVQFSFGLEEIEDDVREKILGEELRGGFQIGLYH